MSQEKNAPNAPRDSGDDLKTPGNLVKIFIGSVVLGVLESAGSSFHANVDWTKNPGFDVVYAVLHALVPASVLGLIRGVELGATAVIIVFLGAPVWAIIGPVLASAAANTVRFVNNIVIAAHSKDAPDKKGKES